MSQPGVKWKHVMRWAKGNDFEIIGKGGDKLVVAPGGWDGGDGRAAARIGHKCCSKPGDELLPCYVTLLKRAFGVTRRQLLNS